MIRKPTKTITRVRPLLVADLVAVAKKREQGQSRPIKLADLERVAGGATPVSCGLIQKFSGGDVEGE